MDGRMQGPRNHLASRQWGLGKQGLRPDVAAVPHNQQGAAHLKLSTAACRAAVLWSAWMLSMRTPSNSSSLRVGGAQQAASHSAQRATAHLACSAAATRRQAMQQLVQLHGTQVWLVAVQSILLIAATWGGNKCCTALPQQTIRTSPAPKPPYLCSSLARSLVATKTRTGGRRPSEMSWRSASSLPSSRPTNSRRCFTVVAAAGGGVGRRGETGLSHSADSCTTN